MKDAEEKNAACLLARGLDILRGRDKNTDKLISARAAEIISLLERYIKEIELFNSAYGLVGTNDTNEIIIRHILDSAAPSGIIKDFLPPGSSVADAGSGAGLPGIPLAVIFNECNFTLIERTGRRAGFLLNTRAALSLSNITVEECELEKLSKRSGAVFDLIVFRAFKPLDAKFLLNLKKLCKPGGVIAAYRGRREKIEAEMAAFSGGFEWEAYPCPVPFLDEQRHLLIIKNINTSSLF
jgi:16S rRNA (guanine527-N7)-methyltransferase